MLLDSRLDSRPSQKLGEIGLLLPRSRNDSTFIRRNVSLLATMVNQNGNRGMDSTRVSIPVFVAILSFALPIRSILLCMNIPTS